MLHLFLLFFPILHVQWLTCSAKRCSLLAQSIQCIWANKTIFLQLALNKGACPASSTFHYRVGTGGAPKRKSPLAILVSYIDVVRSILRTYALVLISLRICFLMATLKTLPVNHAWHDACQCRWSHVCAWWGIPWMCIASSLSFPDPIPVRSPGS